MLENWGLLWMWHSLMIFSLCLLTQVMAWSGVTDHVVVPRLLVGRAASRGGRSSGSSARRRGRCCSWSGRSPTPGPRACAPASACSSIEWLAGLPALTLSPAVAVAAGMVFVFKAGILSGQFYVWAAAELRGRGR